MSEPRNAACKPPGPGRLILLTGERGAGKTTVCARLAARAAAAGIPAGGILTHTLFDAQGERAGLEAEATPGGERWPLARCAEAAAATDGAPAAAAGPDAPSPFALGPFTFLPAGFERAIRHLAALLAAAAGGAAEAAPRLLLLDEAGPLELARGRGFRPFLDRLRAPGAAHAAALLVVVRPSLLDEAARLLRPPAGGAPPEVVWVTQENRDGLPARLLGSLEGAPL